MQQGRSGAAGHSTGRRRTIEARLSTCLHLRGARARLRDQVLGLVACIEQTVDDEGAASQERDPAVHLLWGWGAGLHAPRLKEQQNEGPLTLVKHDQAVEILAAPLDQLAQPRVPAVCRGGGGHSTQEAAGQPTARRARVRARQARDERPAAGQLSGRRGSAQLR